MRIVVGSGRNRHVFDVPPKADKAGRDRIAEDVKNFLFRPSLLKGA